MQYISIHLYRKMLKHALAEGIDRNVFLDLPTPIDGIDKIQAVPAEHFFYLHEVIDDHLGPGFSVRVGQQMKIEDYGVLGLSWRTCSWAGEIFDRCERYFKLLSNTYVFEVDKGKHISRVYLNRPAHRRGLELSNEATLSATVVVLKAITETDISPIQVSFQHKAPSNLKDYSTAFNCEILFEQERNYISYSTEDLETRTAVADASIHKFLLERVEEETQGLVVTSHKLSMNVQTVIRDALPSGIPSIHQVGKHLGMSNRTLTRRLAENRTTFRDLIQATQEEVSRHLLRNTNSSIAEIAFQSGFSEQSAFSRAFKRWTGMSPIEYRKK